MAGVQPSVLRWARETIGKSIADVARVFNHNSTDTVFSWESGEDAPSYPQLERLASLYKRPVAVFFFPEPLIEKFPAQDFRTLPNEDLRKLDPDTYERIRKARYYQLSLHELFEGKNPAGTLIWSALRPSTFDRRSVVAKKIRGVLRVDIEKQSACKSADDALKMWRRAVEDVGVFVFKDTFKQKMISGLSLSDDEFPVIYLNNSTEKNRQVFSLFHELAHVLLRVNGLSEFDPKYIDELPPENRSVEVYCNALAAEILVPLDIFMSDINEVQDPAVNIDAICGNLSQRYWVSRLVILRRLLSLNIIDKDLYGNKAREWSATGKGSGGGGDYFSNMKAYISERFAYEVLYRHQTHKLSVEEASDYLRIAPKNFDGFERALLGG